MEPDDWARIIAIIPAIILHEVSHGWVALAFGDDTAKRAGRLTLNPAAHVDPFGTLILPIIMALSAGLAFGYAKPVPVNPRQLRNPRQHSLYVSLAGPGSNIALAVVAALLFRFVFDNTLTSDLSLSLVVFWFGIMNVALAVFNLLPVPPLDGSALIERVLPTRWWPTWLKWRQWGFGILLLIVLVSPRLLSPLYDWAIEQWLRLLV